MKTFAAADASRQLGSILDAVQHEPIVIRQEDRDVAVVLSMSEYERLRTGNGRAFLDLRNEVAAQAAANGLTEKELAALLTRDEV
ncbi:MAG: type II toxin-antitoxin system Phd/YefM family antitoxin [Candidatus Korobacteraceae bacterium]